MKTDALIGYSGFVGSTLLKQKAFGALFRSTNIEQIGDRPYGQVICAGAPAQKWIANRDPAADRQKIDGLISHLLRIECDSFVLISTVDVFKQPIGVDENTAVDEEGLHAYGANRYRLEQFVREHFAKALIVRLPGLVGPGLRKNVIYDLLNDNNLQAVESRGVFQFYPMVNLGYDIQTAQAAGLELVHLTAEPISVADIARLGFGRDFGNTLEGTPARYDFRSVHAAVFGGCDGYQYSARDTLLAVRAYAQSEPPVIKAEGQ